MTPKYIAIDSFNGSVKCLFSNYPRKELLNRMGAKRASRIYRDIKEPQSDGKVITRSVHIGYVIRGQWFTIYRISTWTGIKSK